MVIAGCPDVNCLVDGFRTSLSLLTGLVVVNIGVSIMAFVVMITRK